MKIYQNGKYQEQKKKGNTPKKNKIKLFPPSRLAEIMFYSFVMFVLGVLAGRGTAPIGFEIDNSHEDRKHFEVPAQFEPVQVKIDFYNELSSDKDFEINKSIIKTEEKLPVKIPLYKGEKKQSELFLSLCQIQMPNLIMNKKQFQGQKMKKKNKIIIRIFLQFRLLQ